MLDKTLVGASDAEVDKVCTYAGYKYLELGIELGFIKEEIDAFEQDHKMCHKITKAIIESWVKKNGHRATWEVLGDALYEVGADSGFIKDVC